MQPILALETTERFGSVALLDADRVLAETELPRNRRSSQTLAPAVDALFRETGIAPREIDYVAVIVGPGSFTGLRVGVATAKMFAYAVGAKIIGLKTHEVVVRNVADLAGQKPDCLAVGVDAQRGDVVSQRWNYFEEKGFHPASEPELIPVSAWWTQAEQQENTVFAGPALERYASRAPANVLLAPERFRMPSAAAAGRLAADRIAAGAVDDLWTLLPVYSRLSAAEERFEISHPEPGA